MARYPYSALSPEAASIRLLHLLPAEQPESPLECYVSDYNLEQPDKVAYHALSYVWGDENKTVDINLGQHNVPVTVNLNAALRALRQTQDERVLWVDALCIDQGNLQEKSAQVRIMWHIYEAAEYVVVWLGGHSMDSEEIMAQFSGRKTQQTLSARQQRMQERQVNRQHVRGCTCVSGFTEYETPRTGLMSILARDWFTRIWTLQEIAAAKRVEFVCDNSKIDGKLFYEEITLAASRRLSLQKVFRKIRPAIELIGPSETAFRRYKSPLVALIERFRSWNATKPVDKVYSLLAFSSDAYKIPELFPNYDQTPYALARRIIQITYPSALLIDHVAQSNAVTFEIEGYILGKISGSIHGPDKRTWMFSKSEGDSLVGEPDQGLDPVAASIFENDWMIDILNERKIDKYSTICLLRDATRPTSLTLDGFDYIVGMLATTEPYERTKSKNGAQNGSCTSWTDVLGHFSTRPKGAVKFRLTWDPFRQPLPSEVSSHTLSPNDPQVQWEARTASLKYTNMIDSGHRTEAEPAGHCALLTNLRLAYWSDEAKLRTGTSTYSITLFTAVIQDWVDVVRLLLESNADASEKVEHGRSLLHYAAYYGFDEVANVLIKYGADINVRDIDHETPLMLAASNNHLKVCELLIKAGASTEMTSHHSRSYLTDPVIKGYSEVVRLLLDADADVQYCHNIEAILGITLLHFAAELGHLDIIRLLLNAGAHVDAQTSTGSTPLHQAAMNGHMNTVRILILAGAGARVHDENGMTPEMFALHQGHKETANIIQLAEGMQPNNEL